MTGRVALRQVQLPGVMHADTGPVEGTKIRGAQLLGEDEERFPARYRMHQYWARKPWQVVRAHIARYSRPGDLVLDPFLGSGVTAFEALSLGRRFVGVDRNPISAQLAQATTSASVSLDNLDGAFRRVGEKVQAEFREPYSAVCSVCRSNGTAINFVWEGAVPSHAFIQCSTCRKSRLEELPVGEAARHAKMAAEFVPRHWNPSTATLPKSADVATLGELYTARAMAILSSLFHHIQDEQSVELRTLLLTAFTSLLPRVSKMVFVNNYRLQRGINPAGVWGEKRYWVPNRFVENNVLYYFNERRQAVRAAKEETNALLRHAKTSPQIHLGSATQLTMLDADSVDYCFTDPPYGGSVQYGELSTIWNSWIDGRGPSYPEIIVDSRTNIGSYSAMLAEAFGEISRVLKPAAHCSLAFQSSDLKVWEGFIRAVRAQPFALRQVECYDEMKRSHNQLEMKGTAKSHLILTFQKETARPRGFQSEMRGHFSAEDVLAEVVNHATNSGRPTPLSMIYDEFVKEWISRNFENSRLTFPELKLAELPDVLARLRYEVLETKELDYTGKTRTILAVAPRRPD